MTNHEHVLAAFDHLGGEVHHVNALAAAMARAAPMSVDLARQLITIALQDGVITMDSNGEIRRA